LIEIIGVGQFGDVNIGTCRLRSTSKKDPSHVKEDIIPVAVKTCKAADMKTNEKFLEEACKCMLLKIAKTKLKHVLSSLDVMQKFQHPHIIR
jgi:focal adhesion kinase 1